MNKRMIMISFIICVMISGCKFKVGEDETYYVPVQDYTGKEFIVGEKYDWKYMTEESYAKEEEAAIKWFKTNYDLDIKVNYMYFTKRGVISSVEWLEDNNLKMGYTNQKKFFGGSKQSGMYLNRAILSYLIHRIYEEEFIKLEKFLSNFSEKYHLLGVSEEYLSNQGEFGYYYSKYYYMHVDSQRYENTIQAFIDNPVISKEELKKVFEEDQRNDIENTEPFITINFLFL